MKSLIQTRENSNSGRDRSMRDQQPGRSMAPPSTDLTAGSGLIKSTVGRGGDNRPEDLQALGKFLHQHGAPAALIVQIVNPLVNGALIERYQREVLGFSRPDGRIDPGGKTLGAIQELQGKEIVASWFTKNGIEKKEAEKKLSEKSHLKAPVNNSAWSIPKAVAALNGNAQAKSTGYCARYVRKAINAGGIKTPGNPVSAYLYKGYLKQFGFVQVAPGSYQEGDIAVISNFPGHRHGHIQMFNGSQWVSDFQQRDFWPGSAYRSTQPSFVIYRMP